jgi:hypothetical protein
VVAKPNTKATRAPASRKPAARRDWDKLDAEWLKVEGSAGDWHRGLGKSQRLALARAKLKQLCDEMIAEIQRRAADLERRSGNAKRGHFMSSWRLAEASLEVIRAEGEGMLAEARALVDSGSTEQARQALVDLTTSRRSRPS